MYAEYLTAMEATAQALWNVLRHVPDSERPAAAEAEFTASDLGAIRQRTHVLAPNDVRAAGKTVFRSLRCSRDYVAVADPQNHEQLNRQSSPHGTPDSASTTRPPHSPPMPRPSRRPTDPQPKARTPKHGDPPETPRPVSPED